ncbi:retinal short-chain dehydrogenase/reductase [Chiua virens]|nr:retinal short-chain dehydrogenase/reductase [Chiua virens]
MASKKGYDDSIPMYDNVDVDMVVKVLKQTAFSPLFTSLIPVFYFFHARGEVTPAVINSAYYCVAVSAFWLLKWLSTLHRNQASLLFAPKPLEWSEQIVLITGVGSSGIGELLANTLAVRNVNVVVLDIKPIQTENYNITYYKCDVSKWEEVEAVSKKVIEEVGHPTMLVNNAGVVQGKLLLDLDPLDIYQCESPALNQVVLTQRTDRTFGVNTFAHFWTLKAFLPKMIERNSGHIVTMASVMGFVSSAQMSDYSASKSALLTMHESLRYELDNRYHAPGIRTTLVCPGHVRTPLFSTTVFPDNFLYRFFVPSLVPVTVVKAVISALDAQESRMLLLPFYTYSALIMRLLPSFLRDFAQKLTYADFAMKDFVKVTAVREDEVGSFTKQESDINLSWMNLGHVSFSSTAVASVEIH